MIEISGFRVVETVYESDQTIIQRALNTHNEMPVVLKCAKQSSLTTFKRICYLHEFNTASALNVKSVLHPIDFLDTPEGLVIIYQDTNCVSLEKAISNRLFQTNEKIQLFYQTADALAQIHSKRWIHMNLSLDHILFDSKNNNIYLIDWQSSVKIDGFNIVPTNFMRGSIETISPELTGFTNFPVDERSDLYSLGCVFYEIFTHSPPFREHDSFQLIQAHVMRKPVPAHEGYDPFIPVAQHVPENISHILSKLLSKDPEDRYDSAQTLKTEISKCISDNSYSNTENILKSSINKKNHSLNREVYECKKEVETLDSIYKNFYSQQVSTDKNKNNLSNSQSTFLIVSGDNGAGKINFCKSIIPSVWEDKGVWFVESFSFLPDLPLSVFGRILSYFLNQMRLKHGDELESQIKQLVYKGLNCPPFLIELIPELIAFKDFFFSKSNEVISEKTDAVPFILSLFKIIFLKFQPIVLCLKNIHLADEESLKFLEKLLVHFESSFFIIGICQKKLPEKIQTLIKSCENQRVDVFKISIDKYYHKNSNKLISDIFKSFEKNANKFFQFASSIGPFWNVEDLCQIIGQSLSEIEPFIQKAYQSGLIVPAFIYGDKSRIIQEKELWKFSDETIQKSIYQLIPLSEKQYIHKQICQLLISRDLRQSSNKSIYLVIRHYSLTELDDFSKEQMFHLARMCISAGERAIMAGISQSAYEFFSYGLSLFNETDWEDNHQLLFDLHLNAIIAANCSIMDKSLENIKDNILKNVKTNLQKLQVYESIGQMYFRNNKFEEAKNSVTKGLKDAGVPLDSFPSFFQRFNILKTALNYKRFQRLDKLNELSDKNLLNSIIIRLIVLYIQTSTSESISKKISAIITYSIHQMKKFNITTEAAYLWVMLARYLIDMKGFQRISENWARMGIAMVDRLTNPRLQVETRLINYWYIDHRKKPAYTILDLLKSEIERCSLQGLILLASKSSDYYLILSIACGRKLKQLLSDMNQFKSHIQLNSSDISSDIKAMCHQTILNLIGGITPPHILSGQAFDEQKSIQYMEAKNNNKDLFLLYNIKLMLSIFFRNKEKSIIFVEKLAKYSTNNTGNPLTPMFHFYSALAYLGVINTAKVSEKKVFKKKIQSHILCLKKWSDKCPENVLHRYYLVKAEYLSKFNLKGDISDCYDQAINYAKANHYYHEYALSNELAGEYYMLKGKEKLARTYIEDAYQAYIAWGADRKTSEYIKQNKSIQQYSSSQKSIIWPVLNKDVSNKPVETKQVSTISRVDHGDIWTLSQNFCTELKLDNLLEKIIQTVLQYSGAHKGCLIIKKNSSWFIEAFLNLETQERYILTSEPLETSKKLCLAIARQVIQSSTTICLWDAGKQGEFQYDEYIREYSPRSLLCLPLSHSDKMSGILYLENKRLTGLFTADRVKLINILSSQAAISIKNAQFFYKQECTVKDRASDLNLTVHQLSSAIQDLEARSREMMLLNQFSDALHGCNTEQTSYDVLNSFANRLFPSDKGELWITKDNSFTIATSWGEQLTSKNNLNIKSCRCYESQNIIFVEDASDSPHCNICEPADDCIYLCVPLKDQSGTMGVLHFQFGIKRPHIFDDTFTRRLESRRMLVCRMIEHYALSLANLRLREALKHESIHDPLTALFNRRHMQETLSIEYKKAQQNASSLGIIMIDIDHFKSFNDTYGHDIGDAVLKHLGSYLKANMCDTLQACRYGGEEFLLMCPKLSKNELIKTAENIRLGIMNDIKVPYKEKKLDVTASLGVALYPENGQTMTEILKQADDALYKAKKNGRNQVFMA